MTHVIAFDFEAAGGCTPQHGFLELGAVLVRESDSKVISSFQSFASMQHFDWEERCLEEFWKRPDMAQRFQQVVEGVAKETKGPNKVVAEFLQWAKDVTKDVEDVYFITDNAPFDAGILRAFSDKEDVMYALGGEYRNIIDTNTFYKGLGGQPVTCSSWNSKDLAIAGLNRIRATKGLPALDGFPKFEVNHDHNPVNDATSIAMHWCFVQNNLSPFNF